MTGELLTVGHGAGSAEALGDLLRAADVAALVDIRIAPGSRRHPHFAGAALAQWLPSYDVRYSWERRLGGYRKPAPERPDVALRNASFRGYAGWMRGEEFRAALSAMLAAAADEITVVMCSETLWWHCHRRLVADAVELAHGLRVQHLLPGGPAAHRPTGGVRLGADGRLWYDAL